MKKLICIVSLFVGCSSPTETTPDATSDAGIDTTVSVDVSSDRGSDIETADEGMTDDGNGDTNSNNNTNNGLRDQALLDALREEAQEVMRPLGYDAARDTMYTFNGLELQNGRVECVYTGRTVMGDGSRTPNLDCQLIDGTPTNCAFNTEHLYPRGLIADVVSGGEFDAAEGDLHHLFPSEETVNNSRSSFEFGETDCDQNNNCRVNEESKLGIRLGAQGSPTCPMDAPCVMQVRPTRSGDVARAMFYMAMRYRLPISLAEETTLRSWHLADPPSDPERARNAAVETVQGNRNPFIDDPTLVDRIADF